MFDNFTSEELNAELILSYNHTSPLVTGSSDDQSITNTSLLWPWVSLDLDWTQTNTWSLHCQCQSWQPLQNIYFQVRIKN